MQWIHYIGGRGKGGKLLSIAIGMSSDPDTFIAKFKNDMPFIIALLGLEEGSQERLEQLRVQFSGTSLHGPWYKPTGALTDIIENLPSVERGGPVRRVSLDLPTEEFVQLDAMVRELGTVTKSRLLRRAMRFYLRLGRYKARGYALQAIKDGKLIQFPDLDDIEEPP